MAAGAGDTANTSATSSRRCRSSPGRTRARAGSGAAARRAMLTRDEAYAVLDTVPDPEVPAISVVELGIVRDVTIDTDGGVDVTITPTYSGCPAMFEIEKDIRTALETAG